jgi:hypothetical protein
MNPWACGGAVEATGTDWGCENPGIRCDGIGSQVPKRENAITDTFRSHRADVGADDISPRATELGRSTEDRPKILPSNNFQSSVAALDRTLCVRVAESLPTRHGLPGPSIGAMEF